MLKKILSIILTLSICSMLPISSTFAIGSSSRVEVEVEKGVTIVYDTIEDRSVSAVLIFVGGILVGQLVDGILIYETGHSGGEWVAKALEYIAKHPGAKEIHLPGDCSVYPPHSAQGCH